MKANSEPLGSLFKSILNLLCGLTSTTFLHSPMLLFLKSKGHLGRHRLIRSVSLPVRSTLEWVQLISHKHHIICSHWNRSPDLGGPKTCRVSAGNQSQILWKRIQCSVEPSLQALHPILKSSSLGLSEHALYNTEQQKFWFEDNFYMTDASTVHIYGQVEPLSSP